MSTINIFSACRALGPALIIVALCAACGGEAEEDVGVVGVETSAIINGRTDDEKMMGVGYSSSGCSMTLLAPNIGLTPARCAPLSGSEVELAGTKVKSRVVRELVTDQQNRTTHPELRVIQFRRELPVVGQPYSKGLDAKPLSVDERIVCRAYERPGRFRQGTFRVVDGSSDTEYYLTGVLGTGAGIPEVSPHGIGGYCERDGTIAAILATATNNGIARAIAVHDVIPAVKDARYAEVASRHGAAVRLLDRSETNAVTAGPGTILSAMARRIRGRGADTRTQAFYLEPVSPSLAPNGQSGYQRLVDVSTGQCITARVGHNLPLQPCERSRTEQMFYMDVRNDGTWDYYSFSGPLGAIQDVGYAWLIVLPGQPTGFRMWLALH